MIHNLTKYSNNIKCLSVSSEIQELIMIEALVSIHAKAYDIVSIISVHVSACQ